MADYTLDELESYSGNSTRGGLSFTTSNLKFNIGNYVNYICIKHFALNDVVIIDITTLAVDNPTFPIKRFTG